MLQLRAPADTVVTGGHGGDMKGRRLALTGAQPQRSLDAVKSRVPDKETLYQAS